MGQIVAHLDLLPVWSSLYVVRNTSEVTFGLDCYSSRVDSREVSEQEIEKFEAEVEAAGFVSFLGRDQLQDIITNLEQQRAQFTRADLERAIDFYWRRDAFMQLSGDFS